MQTLPDNEIYDQPAENQAAEEFPLHSTDVLYALCNSEDLATETFRSGNARGLRGKGTYSKNSSTEVVFVPLTVVRLYTVSVAKQCCVFHGLSASRCFRIK